MGTVPCEEADKQRASEPEESGPRLIVALSCDAPGVALSMEEWTDRVIELSGVSRLSLGRGSDRYQHARPRYREGTMVMVTIPDARISLSHLRLERDRDFWRLTDDGSTNGTWVNGERVTEGVILRDKDVIELGSVVLLYLDARRPTPAPLEESGAPRTSEQDDGHPVTELSTLNPEMAGVMSVLRRSAPSMLSMLLLGPTGVGKEVMANAIHRLSGRTGRLVAINCGSLPGDLLASELFGVQRGAFSGANEDRIGLMRSADGGTLFLDEIAELPLAAQAVLLRALQESQVVPVGGTTPIAIDVRVLAATHQDLQQCVERGAFRRDLLARIRGLIVQLPPLGERREDIGLLVARILFIHAGDRARDIRLSRRAGAQLLRYDWPDNVRELDKALQAALVLSGGETIDLEHLPGAVASATGHPPIDNQHSLAAEAKVRYTDAEKVDRLRALCIRHQGNLSAVARDMMTSRSQVRRLLERYGIDRNGRLMD